MVRRVNIPKEALEKALRAGATYTELAEQYECSPTTISKRVKEYGLKNGSDSGLISSDSTEDGSKVMSEDRAQLGVGLDVGTMNLVSARKVGGSIETKRVRDAFLDVDAERKKMLNLRGTSYVEYEDQLLILGDTALELAQLLKKEVRRPLSKGLISSSEIDALEVLSILIEQVVGKPQEEGEICYYSIPAVPLDNPDQDVVYHEAVFGQILEELGYDPISGNEAMAIIYSECAAESFSGIGVSFGSGMTNVALSYMTMPILEFSVQRGGDWIDAHASKAVGSTASRLCAVKERGIDLMAPKTRDEEALVVYYKSLIKYALDNISKKFKQTQSDTELQEAIPIIVSGGTSLAGGFLDLFKEVFERQRKRFPIEISEIRQAEDPMTSVAQGLLVQSLAEYE